MDPISITVGGLSALGVGGAIQLFLRWKLGGRETVEVKSTVDLTESAMGIVTTLQGLYNGAVTEAKEAKAESAQVRADFNAFRDEINHILREETSWAVAARDDILRRVQGGAGPWPANLSPTPPILALIPGRN